MLALACALAPFVLIELVLRAAGLSYPRFEVPIQIWNASEDKELAQPQALHRHDDAQLWVPREGALIPWTQDERLPSRGFRRADPDPHASWKVLTLGDSSTFGWHVAGHETWSALLEADVQRALDERSRGAGGRVQVLNGGVIGFTIRQGLERYRVVSAAWRPDVVIAGFGTTNEHVPTMDLVDVDKLAWLRERRSIPWRAQRYLRNELRLLNLGAWCWDELHGGREAQIGAFVTRERERRLKIQTEQLEDYPRRVSAEDFRTCLDELDARTRHAGTRLLLVRMPRRADMEASRPQVLEYDAELDAFLARTDVPCCEARALVRERIAAGTPEEELFFDGTHPTARGQRIVADAVLPAVLDLLPSPAPLER